MARKCQVDFVFTDRTFASLVDVTKWGFGGRIVSLFFRYLTLWSEECELNFAGININTYRLLGCDANDNIISDMASLKTGVARSILFNRLSKLIPLNTSKRVLDIKNYLLAESDQKTLAEALESLNTMINDFSFRGLHQPIQRRKQNGDQENGETQNIGVVETHPSVQMSISQKDHTRAFRQMGGMTPQGSQQISFLSSKRDFVLESAHVKHNYNTNLVSGGSLGPGARELPS